MPGPGSAPAPRSGASTTTTTTGTPRTARPTRSAPRRHERRRPHRRDDAHLAGLPLPHHQLRAQRTRTGSRCLGPDGSPSTASTRSPCRGTPSPSGRARGRDFGDWYQPVHQNGNALSYPQLDPSTGLVALDPSTFGPAVTLQGSGGTGGTPVTLPQPLINKAYSVGASTLVGRAVHRADHRRRQHHQDQRHPLRERRRRRGGVGDVQHRRRQGRPSAPTSTSRSTTPTAGARSTPPATAPPPPTPSP